jgi:hypothetical protein
VLICGLFFKLEGYNCWFPIEPYYGEKKDLNSLFELGEPSMSVYEQEGMDGIDVVQNNEGHQSRATELSQE